MTPFQVLLLALWTLAIGAGYFIGKRKAQLGARTILTVILGLLGLVIAACPPRNDEAVAAQRRYQIKFPERPEPPQVTGDRPHEPPPSRPSPQHPDMLLSCSPPSVALA